MNTSYSLMTNSATLTAKFRERHFAEGSNLKLRDNYVLGEMISCCPLSEVSDLLNYQAEDRALPKKAKSVTLTADIHRKLQRIAEILGVSESEACRLVILKMSSDTSDSHSEIPNEIEEQLAILRKALDVANTALKQIEQIIYHKEES